MYSNDNNEDWEGLSIEECKFLLTKQKRIIEFQFNALNQLDKDIRELCGIIHKLWYNSKGKNKRKNIPVKSLFIQRTGEKIIE